MDLKKITKLSERIVGRLLKEEPAGACIPNEPYYTCYHHAKMYCSNDCAGVVFCHQVGTC
jgi:hypothetical protein